MRFISHSTIGSTNAEAVRLAKSGDLGPLWVRADQQTKGKGRRGRPWASESGNLFCTGLYPHFGSTQQAALLSFAAALAVYDLAAVYIDTEKMSLKWPNDVLIGGAKVSGVLLETGTHNDQGWIAIGIGVNLVSHPEAVETRATHILAHIDEHRLVGPEPVMTGPDAALAVLAAQFDYWRNLLLKEGFSPIRTAWLTRAANLPGDVTVRLSQESFTGKAIDLGENGELQVRIAGGTIRAVHAGDVFFGADETGA